MPVKAAPLRTSWWTAVLSEAIRLAKTAFLACLPWRSAKRATVSVGAETKTFEKDFQLVLANQLAVQEGKSGLCTGREGHHFPRLGTSLHSLKSTLRSFWTQAMLISLAKFAGCNSKEAASASGVDETSALRCWRLWKIFAKVGAEHVLKVSGPHTPQPPWESSGSSKGGSRQLSNLGYRRSNADMVLAVKPWNLAEVLRE